MNELVRIDPGRSGTAWYARTADARRFLRSARWHKGDRTPAGGRLWHAPDGPGLAPLASKAVAWPPDAPWPPDAQAPPRLRTTFTHRPEHKRADTWEWVCIAFPEASGTNPAMALMAELAEAQRDPRAINLGGGVPYPIPAMCEWFESQIAEHPRRLVDALGRYAPPAGPGPLREALAHHLREAGHGPVYSDDVVVMNGAQAALRVLLGREGHTLLVRDAEYLGVSGLAPTGRLESVPARVRETGTGFRADLDLERIRERLHRRPHVHRVYLSRPGNPTGAVDQWSEVDELAEIASHEGAELIVDGAYGPPFPGLVWDDATERTHTAWDERFTWILSTSKMGLPGARCAFVVTDRARAAMLAADQVRDGLSTGGTGAGLLTETVRDGTFSTLAREVVRPWYAKARETMLEGLRTHLAGTPAKVHASEGGFFAWIELGAIPGGASAVARRLKGEGVYVASGKWFFPADEVPPDEHLRLTFAAPHEAIAHGCTRLGEAVREAYRA